MNNRERTLMFVLGGILGTFALMYFGNSWFVRPHRELNRRIADLEDEVDKKERQERQYKKDKADQAKWFKLSLPKNPDRASAEYAQMLKPLLRDCGLTVDDFQGTPPQDRFQPNQKKAQHMTLAFQVRGKGTVESVVKALDSLQRMPVMHRVRSIVLDRLDPKDRTARLGVQMTIEAMIVYGADNQPSYLPAVPTRIIQANVLATMLGYPAGWIALPYAAPHAPIRLALADGRLSDRNFEQVSLRNPFVGALPIPPPPKKEVPVEVPDEFDMRDFIRLDTIVVTAKEAFLRNYLLKAPPMRIRSIPGSGFDIFRVMNEDRTRVLVKGKVLRIDPRDVFFQVGEDVYGFHFSQTLSEAMKRPLSEDDLDRLELTSLVDPEFAKEDLPESSKKSSAKMFQKGGQKGKKGKGS